MAHKRGSRVRTRHGVGTVTRVSGAGLYRVKLDKPGAGGKSFGKRKTWIFNETELKSVKLRPGGAKTIGGSATGATGATVRAHIRKGKPVRQHTRHLSANTKSLLAFYRTDKARRGVKIARRSMQMTLRGGPRLIRRRPFS